MRITPRAALLFVVVLVLLSFSVEPTRAYLAQRARIAELERQAQVLQKANADVEQRIIQLRDPEELGRLARECLGMVKRNEVAFVTVPENGGPPPTDC